MYRLNMPAYVNLSILGAGKNKYQHNRDNFQHIRENFQNISATTSIKSRGDLFEMLDND